MDIIAIYYYIRKFIPFIKECVYSTQTAWTSKVLEQLKVPQSKRHNRYSPHMILQYVPNIIHDISRNSKRSPKKIYNRLRQDGGMTKRVLMGLFNSNKKVG